MKAQSKMMFDAWTIYGMSITVTVAGVATGSASGRAVGVPNGVGIAHWQESPAVTQTCPGGHTSANREQDGGLISVQDVVTSAPSSVLATDGSSMAMLSTPTTMIRLPRIFPLPLSSDPV